MLRGCFADKYVLHSHPQSVNSLRSSLRQNGLHLVVIMHHCPLVYPQGHQDHHPLFPSPSHTSRSLKKVYQDKVYCVESHADILNTIYLKPNILCIL